MDPSVKNASGGTMSATSDIQARREQIAVDYFRRVDAGDPAVTELFTPDAVMFYPKFGYARGPAQIAAFARGLARGIAELEHEIDGFTVLSRSEERRVGKECRPR